MRFLECGAQLYRAGDFRAVVRRGQRRLYCAVPGSGQYMVRHRQSGRHSGGIVYRRGDRRRWRGSAAGWLYDLYQSYTLSIALAGMAALLSALGIVLASRCTSRMG